MNDPNSDKHRTNIYLYKSDVKWLRDRHAYGWTEMVREIVHQHIERQKANRDLKDKIWRDSTQSKDFP